mmetsp:Transcript_12990/g.39985  ORF Transcript_12990/g.39985 Transcript_12990/m.39985 type:complete len:243 (+) Transcript_12990:1957-2685(+)
MLLPKSTHILLVGLCQRSNRDIIEHRPRAQLLEQAHPLLRRGAVGGQRDEQDLRGHVLADGVADADHISHLVATQVPCRARRPQNGLGCTWLLTGLHTELLAGLPPVGIYVRPGNLWRFCSFGASRIGLLQRWERLFLQLLSKNVRQLVSVSLTGARVHKNFLHDPALFSVFLERLENVAPLLSKLARPAPALVRGYCNLQPLFSLRLLKGLLRLCCSDCQAYYAVQGGATANLRQQVQPRC